MSQRLFPGALILSVPFVLIAASGHVSGSATVRQVHQALVGLPFYTVFDDLGCRAENGTVTLLGQVTRPELKADAEKAVSRLPGVDRLVDRIEVLPLSASDGKLRLAEYLAIYGDPTLGQYRQEADPTIHIIVKNGSVTLEGNVANQSDKSEAFTQASSAPGVVSLTDHLKVTT